MALRLGLEIYNSFIPKALCMYAHTFFLTPGLSTRADGMAVPVLFITASTLLTRGMLYDRSSAFPCGLSPLARVTLQKAGSG